MRNSSKRDNKKNFRDRSFRYKDLLITVHAQERAEERTSITTWYDLAENAFKSLTEGIDVWADPLLREMIEPRLRRYNDVSGVYSYEGIVYIFVEDRLTTLYPISWLAIYQGEQP